MERGADANNDVDVIVNVIIDILLKTKRSMPCLGHIIL